MPIENELKFVLSDPDGELERKLAYEHISQEIDQFYVTPQNRFRRTLIRAPMGREMNVEYRHALKIMVDGRLLEIETSVSAQDYRLAERAATTRLTKRRISLPQVVAQGVRHMWDIDFLRTAPFGEEGSTYFAMAEVEFPEGQEVQVPSVLASRIALAVPHEESGWFTNVRLADREYAAEVVDAYGRYADHRARAVASAPTPMP